MSNQALSPVVPFSMAIRERVFSVHRPIRCLDRLFADDALGFGVYLHRDGETAGSAQKTKQLQQMVVEIAHARPTLPGIAVGPITTTNDDRFFGP